VALAGAAVTVRSVRLGLPSAVRVAAVRRALASPQMPGVPVARRAAGAAVGSVGAVRLRLLAARRRGRGRRRGRRRRSRRRRCRRSRGGRGRRRSVLAGRPAAGADRVAVR